jgi:hypothetical protein
MILIHPPVAKPAEPPAGIARLSGALKAYDIPHRVVDANLEGLLHLMGKASICPADGLDTWTRRALRNVPKNLKAVRDAATYRVPDRYKRAVIDLNRAIEHSCRGDITLGLSNYHRQDLSPLRSADLLYSAEHPEIDPFYPYFSRRIEGLLEESVPAFVGFSMNYLSQALTTFSMIGHLKKMLPEVTVVVGGGLITSWLSGPFPEERFRGLIDRFVAGPGEGPLLSMKGVKNEADSHVVSYYGAFAMQDYLSPEGVLPYSASAGCYWNRCSFCPEKAEGNSYKPLTPQRVLSDLGAILPETSPGLIHMLDNAISPALLAALADNPPGLPWYGFARFGRQLADTDFCMSLRRSGCVMLKLGLESGDQGVLDRMNKGIDLGTASAALQALKKAGIGTYVYLLFGTPEETLLSARKTLDFTARHGYEIGFMNIAIFNMPVNAVPPGVETCGFYDGDLSLYTDFVHPSGWDRRAVRSFLENEFKRNRAVSAILKKDPPIFTSNHAPFFVTNHRRQKTSIRPHLAVAKNQIR